MFVRLFVDENLDRMIPISKQPKEKIQAIIDSCTRQFPEFAERSRKRIRTYLKSCRRNKKAREGWENTVSIFIFIFFLLYVFCYMKQYFFYVCFRFFKIKILLCFLQSRPTPAHLTSVQAEQILSLACENESMNAKRMRMGMEPISQTVSQTVNSVRFLFSNMARIFSL